MTLDGADVSIRLTQAETKQFAANGQASVQVRVLTNDHNALASQKFRIAINEVLNEDILE